ncbi:hypothetical protein [Halalkalibacter hemicellulosilyticus]|uniref:Uncharacterized protein n=1 Tax=Halalkalibacter hemicellulosilyticusJCM 9152 TaxID=1236971 RepID=W4QNF2_9BACI|nr:hypothetical protein [Halalkalibacter hemicellulosilyticus]GAE32874.1 hypothetical protein JCM9152_4465 [Halalkalibacter hemicellulosilyticusJCM 9152]
MQNTNSEKVQNILSDNLFPEVHHISDVKQVLEEMKSNGQELQEWQVRALIHLEALGNNEYLHPDGNPYEKLYKFIMESKVHVVDPSYYIDTIEALIPKPPKPIVMAEKEKK